jgi:hypothetical protein
MDCFMLASMSVGQTRPGGDRHRRASANRRQGNLSMMQAISETKSQSVEKPATRVSLPKTKEHRPLRTMLFGRQRTRVISRR